MSLVAIPDAPPRSRNGEPTIEVAAFFPTQGQWTEGAYLDLPDDDGPRCELVRGRLELLPMPIEWHESIADYLADRLRSRLGRWKVYAGGYRLRIRARIPREPNDFRYPDVIATLDRDGWGENFATAASFVAEVVSGSQRDRDRDLVDKYRDYAEAGVQEYWVVDPAETEVTVYQLNGSKYVEVVRYGTGQTAFGVVIEGLEVNVDELFAVPPSN